MYKFHLINLLFEWEFNRAVFGAIEEHERKDETKGDTNAQSDNEVSGDRSS